MGVIHHQDTAALSVPSEPPPERIAWENAQLALGEAQRAVLDAETELYKDMIELEDAEWQLLETDPDNLSQLKKLVGGAEVRLAEVWSW